MKRLNNNLPDTTPFINSDFNDILQNQHQLAYSAWLDSMNDEQPGLVSSNCGIIIKGCELLFTEPVIDQTNGDIRFNYNLRFKKTDLVYINGQYYSPSDTLLQNQQYTITNRNQFYIIGVTISNDQLNLVEQRVRKFKNEQYQTFSIDYRFEVILSDFPLPQDKVNYIGFEWGGTSRRLKRLMKYSRARRGDVQMLTTILDKNGWDLTTRVNDLNLLTSTSLFQYDKYGNILLRDFDRFGMGRNEMQGFKLYDELSGKFIVGLSSSAPDSPQISTTFSINYGKIGNEGGTNSVQLTPQEIPNHDHGGFLSSPLDASTLNHSHLMTVMSQPGLLRPMATYDPNYEETNLSDGLILINSGIKDRFAIQVGSTLGSLKDLTRWGYFLDVANSNNVRNQSNPGLLNVELVLNDFKMVNDAALAAQKWIDRYESNDYNYLFGSLGGWLTSGTPQPGGGNSAYWRTTVGAAESFASASVANFKSVWQDMRSIPPPKSPNEPTDLKILSIAKWRDYIYWDNTLTGHTHEILEYGYDTPHENRPPYYVVFYYTKI